MENSSIGKKIFRVFRSVLTAYVVTVLLLFILAFLLYKLELDEGKVTIGIIAVYVISCLIGGFAAGRSNRSRKFLWGLLTGSVYFLILLLVSFGSGKAAGDVLSLSTGAIICMGSGMIGGMAA